MIREVAQPTDGSAKVMSVDLSGRRVLVTGASSGIGADVSRSVVASGGHVAMLARRNERLSDFRDELGERAVGIPCDVTNLEGLNEAVETAAARSRWNRRARRRRRGG